jgi:uncharacterized protein (DUF1697 family)
MSKRGLNSNVPRQESTATSSSLMLSGMRREKEAPVGFDIDNHSTNSGKVRGKDDEPADSPALTEKKVRFGEAPLFIVLAMNYLALLRGVNVGGKGLLRMSELKACLEKAGFAEVRTYIQSGNVLFAAPKTDSVRLAQKIEAVIEKHFAMKVGVVVFAEREWQEIVKRAPKAWGENKDWKHNLLALLPGTNAAEVMKAAGALKPEIEAVTAGEGVLYQSLSVDSFARTNSGKLAGHPIYRRITVRNHNTARKLAELLATKAG